jgi:sterol desaturase/sphingolipid hydroxylase (fatty acid hydroxylase superfamily)
MISLDPNGYFFWLIVVAILCFAIERTLPSRTARPTFRPGFGQDLLWLVFNGAFIAAVVGLPAARNMSGGLLSGTPILLQLGFVLVTKDFLDWCVHNLLHRVPWLWDFHKVHHSIEELDAVGSFRFHWVELLFSALTYVPLFLLGADQRVLLANAVLGTLIQHLAHSNIRIDWGPLKYILSSPQFHAWHHERILLGGKGQNYAVVLCIWDWLFGTAHLVSDTEQPDALGFEGDDFFPSSFLERFTYPLSRWLGRSS